LCTIKKRLLFLFHFTHIVSQGISPHEQTIRRESNAL
jgi:hypothetical protein